MACLPRSRSGRAAALPSRCCLPQTRSLQTRASSADIVVVVSLRVIVVLHHWESDDVVSCARGSAQALNHRGPAHVRQVPVDGQVSVILELELRLSGCAHHLVRALA